MQIWSSIHFFTNRFAPIFEICTLDADTPKRELERIGEYWEKYRQFADMQLDELPLHDIDRHFIRLFHTYYQSYTPPWVIKQDFAQRGLPLNLYGDIIISPNVISVFSPRYFGGFERESLMFYNLRDIAKETGCNVLNQTFILSDELKICKFYFAHEGKLGIIAKSPAKGKNLEENSEILGQMFPSLHETFSVLLKNDDPSSFSEMVCNTLGIIECGPKYDLQKTKATTYKKTERLFNIYTYLCGQASINGKIS